MALAALVVLVPAASAGPGIHNTEEPTPTTLYFHLLDGLNDFPINTQEPDPSWSTDGQVGATTQSTSCLPDVEAAPILDKEVHTLYGYSSPSIVEYDQLRNGRPIVHPERGFSYDVELVTDPAPRLYWYVETSVGQDAADGAPAPVVVPEVAVRATIRTGGDISVDESAYNEGEVLAQGQTAPSTLAGDMTTGPARYIPGTPPVYEFALDLPLQAPGFAKEDGFVLRVDVLVATPGCSDGYLAPSTVRTHSSPEARPRMDLVVRNPVLVEALHPQFVGDDLVVHALLNSPWGSYDVDEAEGGVTFEIAGPSVPQQIQRVQVDHTRGHYTHTEPLAVTLLWGYLEEGAAPGTYTVRMTAWNDQHTAKSTAEATFEIGDGGGCATGADGSRECLEPTDTRQKAPAPALAFLLLGPLAAAWRRR